MSSKNITKFNTQVMPTWCPGCGNYGIWAAVKQALAELTLEPHQVLATYDIGCFGNGANFLRTYALHALHGRALPPAIGAKLANHNLVVLAMAGDGGAYGEGIQHLIHAARYNVDVTYIVADNRRFSLTTGQSSPTTFKRAITKTTPFGEIKQPINPLALSLDAGATFVARGFAGDIPHLTDLIKRAIQHKGFSHIDILQQCVSFNKDNTLEWYKQIVYKLENHKYKPDNLDKARSKAVEFEARGRMPIGVLYQIKKPTYEDQIEQLQGEPLYKRKLEKIDCFV